MDDDFDTALIASAYVSWQTDTSTYGAWKAQTEGDATRDFFDWLNEERAKAFDEGFDQGHYVNAGESRDCGCRNNPYRKADQ